MKKLLFIFALAFGLANTTFAQSGVISKENADAISNYDGTSGHFGYALSARETINVNYALTPKTPSSVAHFMIHTPNPMPFHATVTDASGKTVYNWKPVNTEYLYNADWNISALSAGTYTVKIFLGAEIKTVHQFNFTKK